MSADLTVVGLSNSKLAFTNAVFISAQDAVFLTKERNYMQLKGGKVFVVKSDPSVNPGEIALNKMQRICTKVSMGEPIPCATWEPLPDLNAQSVSFEVDLLGAKRFAVKEDDLVPFLKTNYLHQALSKDQIFCTDFNGISLSLTVTSVQVATNDEKEFTRYAPVGMLNAQTEVEIVANADNKKLSFEKSASARRSPLFKPDWKFADMGIGGLDQEFSAIFRRSFASRLFPPDVIQQLGIKHVKGMLLYGPPGTGKTLIARQIGKMLAGKEPKVVNGPEILNKYVGASEENIRKLFEEAEADYAANGEASELHIIIFDEIDAICKQRGSNRGGTGVHDTIVNQLLTKIDGVNSPNNLLVIGMTNRKDMIDQALLRPGRLEVHVEIGLPDEEGRLQIWNIHTQKMREGNYMNKDVDLPKLAELSKNFSGAEIEGVVKSASSYALYGSIDVTQGETAGSSAAGANKDKQIMVTMDDFVAALGEVTPAFGVAEDELKTLVRGELIDWGMPFRRVMDTCRTLRSQVTNSESTPLLSVLLEGVPNSGKTAIIAKLAVESDIPYVRIISAETLLGYDERQKCDQIQKVFEDSYKSPLSLILLDNIERLLEYVPIGPRFSNSVLQCLQTLVKRIPTKESSKLMILATTSNLSMLEDMDFKHAFNVVLQVPQLTEIKQVLTVLQSSNPEMNENQLEPLAAVCPLPIGIKQLLMVIEMAKQGGSDGETAFTQERLQTCFLDAGLL